MRRCIPAIPAFLFLAGAAILLPGAAPDAAAQQIQEVRIYAKSLETGADYAWVNPGGTLVLPPRVEVRLRIEAIPASGGPRYPSGRFEDAPLRDAVKDRRAGGGIAGRQYPDDRGHRVAGVHDVNAEMGSAVLQTYGREGESAIRYTIVERGLSVPSTLRTGTFVVRVDDDVDLASALPEIAPPLTSDPFPVDREAARGLVAELYRGILMREPEAQALDDWSDRITDRGYPEAIAVAMDIAASEESRVDIYRNGTTYEQRLGTLYDHVLGLDPGTAGADRWRSDLERLRAGEVEQVVGDMVRSAEFRQRFDFPDRRFARSRN